MLHISDTDLSINSGGLYYFYPFHSIDRIERSIGKKRNTKRGMIIGGISGSLVIGLIEWASYKPCQQTGMWSCLYYPENSGTALGQGLVTGAILGGSAGGIIGTFWKTDVWQRVPLPVQFYQASIHHQGLQKQVAGITVRFPVKTNKNVYKGNR